MSDNRPFALAGARPQYGPDMLVRVLHIDLWLRPLLATKTLEGVCTTTVEAIENDVRSLTLNAVDLDVSAVACEGLPLAFRTTSETLTLDFARALAAGQRATFAVTYRARDPQRGLYFIANPRQAWTQSQDQDARAWFPCLDHPARKAPTSATIVVPRGLFALSNGKLVERTDSPTETTFRYEQNVPHATYLVTMVVGDFAEIAQSHARVPVSYYVEKGREADGERAFGNTPQMIDCFERTIGVPYPYDVYGQIAVSEFIFGGMENTAATTQTDRTLHDARAHLDFSSDPLVSHELAHQWFGDLVTCRDWSQAWLNEGFAMFFEAVWKESDLGWDEYVYDIYTFVQQYLDEDGERYRRPIVCNVYRDPIELFDAHLYQKGGAVLHMLRGELGWERMKRALTRYVTDNAQRNVETIDLVRAIEAATGRDVRGFFAQWLDRGGHPELRVATSWDAERKTAFVTLEQTQTIDAAHPAYIFDIDLGFVATLPARLSSDAGDAPLSGEIRVRVHVEHQRERFAVVLDAEPKLVRIDPAAYVLSTLRYDLTTEMNVSVLAAEPSPISRIRAAKALAKDGTRSAREALSQGLQSDPFWGVAREIAHLLGTLRSPFARDALLANLDHPHPKVRAAIAAALGNFREAGVASALLDVRDDRSYYVVADAYTALGKTRDARAFDALVAGIAISSWNETIAAGAARGLAELADERALPHLLTAFASDNGEGLRRAAVRAIGRLGALVEMVRTRTVDALEDALRDATYHVRVSAYGACEDLADARLLGSLDRLATTESDGRLRRLAAEAAIRVREAHTVPAEVVRMREELETLRTESQTLRERLDAIAAVE